MFGLEFMNRNRGSGRPEQRKVALQQILVEEIQKDEEVQKNVGSGKNFADMDTDEVHEQSLKLGKRLLG
ncbi:microfibrillar-associated protein 1-like [Quillaja saponaria]|uniref:Microfibrillar-associated protein 1-like n=1 Tax=Quillaja saponaria TaxID=32244 RepID=A0AAD7VEH0_QUISA|nr:microfibrillar-associated protein 1-like [Quillaja saponaria]